MVFKIIDWSFGYNQTSVAVVSKGSGFDTAEKGLERCD